MNIITKIKNWFKPEPTLLDKLLESLGKRNGWGMNNLKQTKNNEKF